MAEELNTENEGSQVEKKSNNMLLIVIMIVLILIIVIVAVIAIMLSSDSNDNMNNAPQAQERSSSKSQRVSSSANYDNSRQLRDIGTLYPLDTFTVNLKSDTGSRYLKVTMSLELNDDELSVELDNRAPVVRDRIIRILSSKTLEEISSKKGKAKVSTQIMDTLNAMTRDGQIKGIYFTEFVIQ